MNQSEFDARQIADAIVAANERASRAKSDGLSQFLSAAILQAKSAGNASLWAKWLEGEYGVGHAAAIAKAALTTGAVTAWDTGSGRVLSRAFVDSIAQRSLWDAVARHALTVPPHVHNVYAATYAGGGSVEEGAAKSVGALALTLTEADTHKVAAIAVFTAELVDRFYDTAARRAIERELSRAVLDSGNAAFLAAIATTPESVPAGSGVLAQIHAGLAAAQTSRGYVVAMPQAQVLALAGVLPDGRIGPQGGQLYPDVAIVAAPSATGVTVIPSGAFLLSDMGLRLDSSCEATLELSDEPTQDSTGVSMFQSNSVALLAERTWRMRQTADAVAVTVEAAE